MPPARKTTAKRPAARPEPITGPDGEPLLELHTKKTAKAPVAMEPAFTVDGRVFSVPVEVKAQVAIRYMDHCRRKGENYGLSWLLEEVLGSDAYEALLKADLENDELIAIAKIAQSKVIGSNTTPKG